MATKKAPESVLLCNYEYPNITSNAGGGGAVTKQLHTGLEQAGVDTMVATDEADGHYATYPVRRAAQNYATIRTYGPDIVHGHFSLPTSLGLRELTPDETPLVVSVMGADVYDPTRFDAIRPVADALNRHILRSADAAVAPSSDMANRVQRKYGVDCRVIRYGIDVDEWTWRQRSLSDTPTILSVSRLVERKQLPLAVDAVDEFRDRNGIDAEYRIVGKGPQRERLEKLAANRDWLTIVGYADNLQAEFNTADMFFLPSAHEAFGVVFLEALAAGLPVVTTPNGGQTDIVTTDVGSFGAPTVNSLAQALERVYEDYESRQAATEGYVESKFTVERMRDEYLNLYAEVLR